LKTGFRMAVKITTHLSKPLFYLFNLRPNHLRKLLWGTTRGRGDTETRRCLNWQWVIASM
jgi:hypothetical protein